MFEKNKKTFYVVDGSYYIYRAFHASPTLNNKEGHPTGALLLFVNMLRRLRTEFSPDFLVVSFDPMGVKTFRHEIFPAYKGHRSEDPPDLIAQLPHFRPIARALGMEVIERDGFEADDVMATLARSAAKAGMTAVIVSGDKDLMQLLDDPNITLLDTMASRRKTYTREEVIARFQVEPALVPDVLALAGDTSDNIPGVPGIGEKTAGKLLLEFGSLENLFANIDKVSGKKRKQNLTEHQELVRLYRKITDVKIDLEGLAFDPKSMAVREPDPETLLPIFERFEFFRLIDELSLKPEEDRNKTYDVILTQEAFDEVLEALRGVETFCVDLETTSVDPMQAEIVGVALAWKPNHGVYIPLKHHYLGVPKQLNREAVLSALKPILEAEAPGKIGQHCKYEYIVLARHGVTLSGMVFDTMLASYVLDPGRKSHSLDSLAETVLRYNTIRYEDVAGKGKKKRRFDQVEIERATPYAAEDADVTMLLAAQLRPQLSGDLEKLHDEIELPLARVLSIVERNGIRINPQHLRSMSSELLAQMQALETRAYALVGKSFNLNSPKQLTKILYEDLDLKPTNSRRTTHGYSTNQETLESILDQHALPGIILEYRSVSKLRSTYTEAIPALQHPETGRVHTSFNQAVAATGRLSSSGPNLQNIPVRTEQGRRIRQAFIPADGWQLFSADYSQIELRLMAHLSQDPIMLEAFTNGQDIHARTASAIFNVALDAVTKDQRRAAKTVNFGVLYGMGTSRLAHSLEITQEEATAIIESFTVGFATAHAYFTRLIAMAEETRYAETLMGRRRYLPELQSKRSHVRAVGERMAINTPIQGTAADLIKLAMIRVQERLEADGYQTRMLLQVHDELVFEVPPEELERLAEMVRAEMEGIWSLSIPLKVDLAFGATWADLKPWETSATS